MVIMVRAPVDRPPAGPFSPPGQRCAVRRWQHRERRGIRGAWQPPRGAPMPGKGDSRTSRTLKEVAGLVAVVAARRGLQVGWRRVTGEEPPAAPDDSQVPLGQAVAWTLVLGAAITTARMIASRYMSSLLLPRRQQRGLPEPAPGQTDSQDHPLPQPEAPGLLHLILLAVLVWQRRR